MPSGNDSHSYGKSHFFYGKIHYFYGHVQWLCLFTKGIQRYLPPIYSCFEWPSEPSNPSPSSPASPGLMLAAAAVAPPEAMWGPR